MKRMSNLLILLVCSISLIAAWLFIPERLLDRQREEVFCQRSAVLVENVQPYGEEYAETRRILKRACEVHRESLYTTIHPDYHPEYGKVAEAVPGQIQAFTEQWNESLWAYFAETGAAFEDNVYLCLQDDRCELAFCYCTLLESGQTHAAPILLYLEPTRGIPVAGAFHAELKAVGLTVTELWEGLCNAYAKSLGVSFREIDLKEEAGAYSMRGDVEICMASGSEIVDVNHTLLAESLDGSYRLRAGIIYETPEEVLFDFELSVP